MHIRLVIVSAALAIGLGASYAPAEPAKFEQPFGFLQKDSTCPEATHILKHPCPGGPDLYLTFPKAKETDLVAFLGQDVAIRGTQHTTTCSRPLIQVTKITMSAIVPPCVDPGP